MNCIENCASPEELAKFLKETDMNEVSREQIVTAIDRCMSDEKAFRRLVFYLFFDSVVRMG